MDSNLTYLGVIFGLIGSITGIFGAILAYLSYKKVNAIKALDLRLELKKAENTYRVSLSLLDTTVENSRNIINEEDYLEDRKIIDHYKSIAPLRNANYEHLSPRELELKLVEVHHLQQEIDIIEDKYQTLRQRREKLVDRQRAQQDKFMENMLRPR